MKFNSKFCLKKIQCVKNVKEHLLAVVLLTAHLTGMQFFFLRIFTESKVCRTPQIHSTDFGQPYVRASRKIFKQIRRYFPPDSLHILELVQQVAPHNSPANPSLL